MNIEEIIEALETACEFQKTYHSCVFPDRQHCEGCVYGKALAEARKMQEPCVWKMVGDIGFAKMYKTCKGEFVLTPNIVQGVECCFRCGRKVKYED